MREILFRGKTDDGECVYGSFCMDAREQFNGLCGVDGFIRLYDNAKGKMQTYEVDRETVGQYTGLKDKNGVNIFEGDIVGLFGMKGKVMQECGAFGIGFMKTIDYDLLEARYRSTTVQTSASTITLFRFGRFSGIMNRTIILFMRLRSSATSTTIS